MTLACSRTKSIIILLHFIGCFIAVAVMIVLPAEHTRRFGLSYKPIEVRQAAARHEFVGFFDDATEPEIEVAASFPPGAGRAEANLNFHVSAWPGPQVIEAHDAITRRHIHRLTLSSDPCGPPLRI